MMLSAVLMMVTIMEFTQLNLLHFVICYFDTVGRNFRGAGYLINAT